TFAGEGTYYDPGLGACGKTNKGTELIAAINAPQYGNTPNPNNAPVCGKCALVKGPLGQVKVKIVDRCPVCKTGDLDLSPSAFNKIGKKADGRIKITWSF
ncbi:barwin-like endoglucanase, partial [Linderina pennispora]